MKALVTGGAGFIGSNLVKLLLSEGHEVTVIDDLSSGNRNNLEELDVRLCEASVLDMEALRSAAEDAEAIFHLAASVGNKRAIDHPIEDSTTNVLGTLNVLEVARRLDVRKVVYSSSAGVLGELKELPITERHPLEPDSPYGVSKLAGELHCLAYAKLYGIEAICLRYFNVYGPGQRFDAYGNVIPIFVHRMLRDEILTIYGDGEQTRDFVNVQDVARANYLASRASSVTGRFNIASATRISINELIDRLASASGTTPRCEHADPRPGDVRDSLADISAAKNALGWRPQVSLDEGLPEYWRWAQEELR